MHREGKKPRNKPNDAILWHFFSLFGSRVSYQKISFSFSTENIPRTAAAGEGRLGNA
jgi:hypothetical protein